MKQTDPSESEQRAFWDTWNTVHRNSARGIDPFMQRQARVALEWIVRVAGTRHILEVGCGTGWLSSQLASFGQVTGVDLSAQSIADARERFPAINFLAGDFAALPLEGPYNFVVSADVIAHVADQALFVEKVASLMRSRGLFVLMTQNPFVWNRSSYLQPQGKGQIRNWPSRGRLAHLLVRSGFRIVHRSSIFPGGDRGVLRITNSYKVNAILKALLGESRRIALYERMFIGRELVMVAERV